MISSWLIGVDLAINVGHVLLIGLVTHTSGSLNFFLCRRRLLLANRKLLPLARLVALLRCRGTLFGKVARHGAARPALDKFRV